MRRVMLIRWLLASLRSAIVPSAVMIMLWNLRIQDFLVCYTSEKISFFSDGLMRRVFQQKQAQRQDCSGKLPESFLISLEKNMFFEGMQRCFIFIWIDDCARKAVARSQWPCYFPQKISLSLMPFYSRNWQGAGSCQLSRFLATFESPSQAWPAEGHQFNSLGGQLQQVVNPHTWFCYQPCTFIHF